MIAFPTPKTAAQTLAELLQDQTPFSPPTPPLSTLGVSIAPPVPKNPVDLASTRYNENLKSIPTASFVAAGKVPYEKSGVEIFLDSLKSSVRDLIPSPIDLIPQPAKYALVGLGAILLWKILR